MTDSLTKRVPSPQSEPSQSDSPHGERSEIGLTEDTQLSLELFIEVEERIAALCEKNHCTPLEARTKYWEPAASLLKRKLDQSDADRMWISRLVEEAVGKAELYNRSNLGMELLRVCILTPRFNWPSFHASALVYDPFLRGVPKLTYESVKRVFLDTNVNVEGVETMFSESSTTTILQPESGDKESISSILTVPQAVPGLGFLSSIPKYPTMDRDSLERTIAKLSGSTDVERASMPTEGVSQSSGVTTHNARTMRKWAEETTERLKVRLLVVNMAANLETTSPLVKYRLEAVDIDQRSRGQIITTSLAEAINPFIYPPTVLPTDGFFSKSTPNQCTLQFGSKGPMFVVLDYGYDTNRYHLLCASSASVPLPPTASVASMKYLNQTPSDTNLYTLHAMQHYTFMAIHLPLYSRTIPETLASLDTGFFGSNTAKLPSKGVVTFSMPTSLFTMEEKLEVAMQFTEEYMRRFVVTGDSRPQDSLPPMELRLREATMVMFLDEMHDAIITDLNDLMAVHPSQRDELFSPSLESGKVLTSFENHFLGLMSGYLTTISPSSQGTK